MSGKISLKIIVKRPASYVLIIKRINIMIF